MDSSQEDARQVGGEVSVPRAPEDLAPEIFRARLVIEGVPAGPVGAADITGLLWRLSRVAGMRVLADPVTHRSDRYGWAGWVHWEASGAHVYAWEQPRRFFSVDVYTCAPFDVEAVVSETRQALGAESVVWWLA